MVVENLDQWVWARYNKSSVFYKKAQIQDSTNIGYGVRFEDGTKGSMYKKDVYEGVPNFHVNDKVALKKNFTNTGSQVGPHSAGEINTMKIGTIVARHLIAKSLVAMPTHFSYQVRWKMYKKDTYWKQDTYEIVENALLPVPYDFPKYLVGDIIDILGANVAEGRILQAYGQYDIPQGGG